MWKRQREGGFVGAACPRGFQRQFCQPVVSPVLRTRCHIQHHSQSSTGHGLLSLCLLPPGHGHVWLFPRFVQRGGKKILIIGVINQGASREKAVKRNMAAMRIVKRGLTWAELHGWFLLWAEPGRQGRGAACLNVSSVPDWKRRSQSGAGERLLNSK